jgi:threonyl-tRNA synthetase
VGDKEAEGGTVSVRRYGEQSTVSMALNDFVALIKQEIQSKKINEKTV